MADDQPSQDIIETSSRSETELFSEAIQSSLANFTIQVTQVLDNKLGEIKEQLVSNKSLKSGSLFCNQNDQQLSGESANVHTDKPTVDDYNTQHDTSSGCGVQHNREVDQDSISVHAGDDDMTVSSHSEAETDLEGKIVKFVSMSSSSDRGNLSTKSVLNVLTQDLVDIEKLSPSVHPALAEIVSKVWTTCLSQQKLNDKKEKFLRPDNIDSLVVKKCNEEIWALNTGKMPHIRSNDIKLQRAQNTYIKATLPIIRLAHGLVSARENPVECKIDPEKALQECMDALMLQAAAQSQLDNFRRGQFKAILPNDLRSLAADPNDGSKLLFGDNLDKRIQDINAQSKIKSSLATNGHSKSSYRSSGSRENSHHLHKLEHHTKNFNSFPPHQKSPAWGKQAHKRRRVSSKRKTPY